MELKLQAAHLDQLDLIMKWRMIVLKEVFAPLDPALEPVLIEQNRKYYQKHLADGSHLCFFLVDIATDPSTIVGCGGICLWQEMPSPDNHTGQCAYLMNIYVKPSVRHHDAATYMVEQFLALCKKRNISKIYLETSQAGRSLYEKCGFIKLKDYMIYQETQSESE